MNLRFIGCLRVRVKAHASYIPTVAPQVLKCDVSCFLICARKHPDCHFDTFLLAWLKPPGDLKWLERTLYVKASMQT